MTPDHSLPRSIKIFRIRDLFIRGDIFKVSGCTSFYEGIAVHLKRPKPQSMLGPEAQASTQEDEVEMELYTPAAAKKLGSLGF